MVDTRRLAGAPVVAGFAPDPWRGARRRPDGAEVILRPGTFELPAAPTLDRAARRGAMASGRGGAGVTLLTRVGAAWGGGDA